MLGLDRAALDLIHRRPDGPEHPFLRPMVLAAQSGHADKDRLRRFGVGLVVAESETRRLAPVRNPFRPVVDQQAGDRPAPAIPPDDEVRRIEDGIDMGVPDAFLVLDGGAHPDLVHRLPGFQLQASTWRAAGR